MKLTKNRALKGHKGRFKVLDISEDGKTVIISYNGQSTREYEILHDKYNKAYILHNNIDKVFLIQ